MRASMTRRLVSRTAMRLLACVAFVAGVPAIQHVRAEPVLDRVVLVQRHGVRAPTQSPEMLAEWSARGWPRWPVAPGQLTERGGQVVAMIAGGIRKHYVAQGLLPAGACPSSDVVVWADSKDDRTRDSGQQLAAQLAPGCGLPMQSGTPGAKDSLFDSVGGSCTLDAAEGTAAMRAALGPDGDLADAPSKAAIPAIFRILRPDAAAPAQASTFRVDPDKIVISGPLAIAAPSGEIFLLEYANNMPAAEIAWGGANTAPALAPLLAPRNRLSELTRRLPYLAVRQGAGMARAMLAVLSGEARTAAPAIAADVKLVAFAGHDDNLSNMAGVFGVDWTLPGQPDATAPATAFALERRRDAATGNVTVALRLFYAELEGMRQLDPASVRSLPVAFPGCGPEGCPLDTLRSRVLAALPPACGR